MTRMARLAATDFGADWVVNSDADEFWWPRGESLRDVLAAVPDRYGTVSAFLRVFVPRPGDGPFAERMTVRFSPLAPINDPASLYKPIRKVIHRGHPEIRLTRGNHALVGSPFAPLRGWFPVEVFHFPLRTAEQTAHKAYLQGTAFQQHIDRAPTAYHRNMFAALNGGRIGDYYESLVVDDDRARPRRRGRKARGRHEATRCASESSQPGRRPTFPIPTLVEDAEYAVEAAVLGEADVVRLQRRLDELESRLHTLEARTGDARLPEADAHGGPCARSREVLKIGWRSARRIGRGEHRAVCPRARSSSGDCSRGCPTDLRSDPKAGSTAVLWGLLELTDLDPAAFRHSTKLETTRALTIHDASIWGSAYRLDPRRRDPRELFAAKDWLSFTVVRDPMRRIWSAWVAKILVRDPRFVRQYGAESGFPNRRARRTTSSAPFVPLSRLCPSAQRSGMTHIGHRRSSSSARMSSPTT